MLEKKDIEILRTLSQEYALAASLPVQDEKKKLWMKLNTLSMERPLVLIDQIPWNEMDADGFLRCQVQDPYWREVECSLRQMLYKWKYMPADMVLNPYICLPRPISSTGWGISAKSHRHIILEKDATASSTEYENQIQCPEDLEKIHTPQMYLDCAKEKAIIQTAEVVFSGIIPFRMTGQMLHLGIWDSIASWMGVTNCYIELMDRPEMIHALMEKLITGLISMVEQLNAMEGFDIHSNVCHCSHTFLPDLPKEDGRALSENAWAFGLAQLFTSVSPRITKEFEVDYMLRLFPYFGAIYYGCCDRLDDRMDVIEKLPKIRKLSCSPWSHREDFAAKMPASCVMSNKPNPAYLASGTLDEQLIRKDLRRSIAAAKANGRSLEIILKDISTVAHNPTCLWRWQEIAMEEVMR